MEHRCGCRIPTDIAVLLLGSPATIGAGRVVDVSMTGAFVETKLNLALLSPVSLEATGPIAVDRASARLDAYVVRHGPGGVGLEWCDPTPHAVAQLLATALNSERIEPQTDRAQQVSAA